VIDPAFSPAFRDALNHIIRPWRLSGGALSGPGGVSVHFSHRHESSSPGHVDVEFRWGGQRRLWPPFRRTATHSVWDCVAGSGETMEERARFAARVWVGSTAMACMEFVYSRRGHFADHFHAGSEEGLGNWHAIQSPLVAYGKGDAPGILQAWCTQHPLLPALAPALGERLPDRAAPYGIKILLGAQDVAEVRIDGEHDEIGSAAVLDLPWPRLAQPGFVRTYALLLHREGDLPRDPEVRTPR
jgi:hypothetical protein